MKAEEMMRQERIDEAIKRLEGIKFEAGTYHLDAARKGNLIDERYFGRLYNQAANIIAILKDEPLPYPPKGIEP